MTVFVWCLVVLVIAGYVWYLQHKWEKEHPGQRGWFFQ